MGPRDYVEIRTDDDDELAAGDGGGHGAGRRSSAGTPASPGHKDLPRSRCQSMKEQQQRPTEAPVSWRDLPQKKQLLVLTLTRLSEPLVQTSLQAYMFYQLKWFGSVRHETLPDNVVARQAGILHASFTAAQFLTAMLWGRVADSARFGRKTVLLVGLAGTTVSCVGFGFATSFWQALAFRVLGGATNGNVGVLRTMISEIIREKKYQSRAFLLLPMTFNIGVIVGPIFGGLLSDPAGSYPALFGKVEFLKRYPYATPNLVSACFLTSAALGVWLLLDETHEALRDQPGGDLGRRVGRKLWDWLRLRFQGSLSGSQVEYRRLGDDEDNDLDDDARVLLSPDATMSPLSPQGMASNPFTPVSPQTESQPTVPPSMKTRRPRYTQRLPFRRIFTRNVVATLAAHVLLALHLGTMNTLWFVFLSTPVWDPPTRNPAPNLPSTWHPRPPFVFTGGLGLPPRLVGLAMALLGILGITLQLLLYPRVSARLGTVTSWRLVLALCFPAVYILAPFLALVPSASPPPAPKDGAPIWLALCGILALHTLGRTFALPAQTILVNNCAPHPSVLGTVHGMAQSVSSFARTVGPIGGAWLYGEGLRRGMVGAVWWGLLAVAAIAGAVECWWVREGDGHEIWLEGDVDEDGVDDAVVEQVEVEDMERGVAGGEVGSGRAVGR